MKELFLKQKLKREFNFSLQKFKALKSKFSNEILIKFNIIDYIKFLLNLIVKSQNLLFFF